MPGAHPQISTISRAKPTKTLLVAEKAVAAIKAQLSDEAPNARVDCGTARMQVVDVGGAMECTVSAGGKRQVVRVVAEDVNGNVHFEPG